MKIAEIFDSIQGEGSWIGRSCTFIRLQGCSLHCSFCDSASTWKEGTEDMSITDILGQVHKKYVVITGGEPTEQADAVKELIQALHASCHTVAIESNGLYEHYDKLGADWIVVSPKPNACYHVFLNGINELKYVVTKEFEPSVAITERIREMFGGNIWLQPCDYGDGGKSMYQKVLDIVMSDDRYRAGIQLHKVFGVR